MRKPRCGLPDIPHHEQNTGKRKWTKTHLTWKFHLADAQTLKTTAFAFSLWAANLFLSFERKTLNPDILISYCSDTHTRTLIINVMKKFAPLRSMDLVEYSLTRSILPNYIAEIYVDSANKPLNIEDILAIQQLYGIKNPRLTTTTTTTATTQPPTSTTDITTNKPDYMNFLPDNFSLSAAYQTPSGEIVLFVNNMIYMVDYPSFKLKEDWPKYLSSLGFPMNTLINIVVNTNREQTYAIFDNNDVAQIDECSMSVRLYQSLQAVFPGIPSAPTLAFRYMHGNIYLLKNNFTNLTSYENCNRGC
ncbi:hypothetical protein ALC56_00246 [Trachymyrmex septentrionalis]|uniref:Uncharacterized protein n=1 Tax=Trachymyrmex septentrionalis TaxID=34720 RepID=A0A151K199_9HYME|nr:hypothetical protein ALC56_00246 [Trachymyrmex septentrionalis]